MKKMSKGFTLIEIMIVVAIIAILAAIAIPNFIAYRQTSQQNSCKANLRTIANACEAYEVKKGTTATIALSDLTDATAGAAFLKEAPKCPYDSSKSYTITKDSTTQRWVVTCGAHDAKKHDVNEATASSSN